MAVNSEHEVVKPSNFFIKDLSFLIFKMETMTLKVPPALTLHKDISRGCCQGKPYFNIKSFQSQNLIILYHLCASEQNVRGLLGADEFIFSLMGFTPKPPWVTDHQYCRGSKSLFFKI